MTRLVPQHGDLPWTPPSSRSPSGRFWEACRCGELLFQRCGNCSTATFPPFSHCRVCQSDRQAWERSAGRGALYSWTTVWRPVTPDFTAPYVVAIVDLAEGYQMLTNVIGCEPDDLHVGMLLNVVFHAVNEKLTLPYFQPVEAAGSLMR